MKITAGIGTIEDYELYVNAGADEVFAGYVPQSFEDPEGMIYALNRREVFYYNVQLGCRNDLEILREMVKVYHKPVAITLNSLIYGANQYPKILSVIEECVSLGFDTFIIADPVLLLQICETEQFRKGKIQIHLSGECGEVNSDMIREFGQLSINRIIFHRKNSIADMKQMIRKNAGLEYEAFVLNELCQYNGSFCNSIHCDELVPACRLPYRLEKNIQDEKCKQKAQNEHKDRIQQMDLNESGMDDYLPGRTGCGLCALWKLRDAGVEYLKLVGRGNYTDDMVKDIKALRKALDLLEESKNETEYQSRMKEDLFPNGCSGRCYYLTDAF